MLQMIPRLTGMNLLGTGKGEIYGQCLKSLFVIAAYAGIEHRKGICFEWYYCLLDEFVTAFC